MSDALPPAERLLNLVIALVNTSGRMTKEQIRTSVAGYDREGSTEAFERMFERDKETLRELGVPVVTVHSAAHGDDAGYRVDLDAYSLPPMELSAAQLGVLGLAAEFWQDQTLRTDAARAWHPAAVPVRARRRAGGRVHLPRGEHGGGAAPPGAAPPPC